MRPAIVYELSAPLGAQQRVFRRKTSRRDAVLLLHARRPRRVRVANIVADRFVAAGTGWIDLATGDPVRLHIEAAGTPTSQLAWADRSAALSRLRHPLINPLLDFGALDAARRFEAYGASGQIVMNGAVALRLLAHGVRFLQAHAITLSGPASTLTLRPIVAGRPSRGRPLGVVLQRRVALDTIAEILDTAGPGGVSAIDVCGDAGSGLRTLQGLVARAARIRGYVPVSPRALDERPWLIGALLERHVCILNADALDPSGRSAVARFLARLSGASARRHVVVNFSRARSGTRHGVRIERMGVRAMNSMIYVDSEDGPTADELFSAARDADGCPGVLLARLHAGRFAVHQPRVFVFHETPAPYVIDSPPAVLPLPLAEPVRRRGDVLRRAVARGDDLARRGRHVAASRLLSRAVRVFEGRGDRREAAECAYRLGSLELDRGRVIAAAALFERARDLAPDASLALAASIALGVAWLDDSRLVEAEALLRTSAVSGATLQSAQAELDATRALARVLYWRGRYDEAAGVLAPLLEETADCRRAAVLALGSRVRLAQGALPQGTQLARRALESASAGLPRVRVSVHRAMAAALAVCGDVSGAQEHIARALSAAREGHLPLAALRVRATWLEILAASSPAAAVARRLAARLRDIARGPAVPRLLQYQIGVAVRRVLETPADEFTAELEHVCGVRQPPPVQRSEPTAMAELSALMELCHAAPDDHSALDRVCTTLLDKLRAASVVIVGASEHRVVAQAGRAWHGELRAATRALAGTPGELLDLGHDPRQAAEPVRYGGEIVAALTARWIAGTDLDVARACGLLKMGALACAASVRAVLDRVQPAPPSTAWPDLLGQSAPALALRASIERAARAPFPVLIEGESGCGKELVARAIHRLGPRCTRRFCAVNCAALTDELLEAELFGHTRGAFTGAIGDRAGLFEDADGGTLFLDEVAELSPRAQAKLLRVVQDGEVRRVGENFPRRVDVRIVAATNRPLVDEVSGGRFRADLRFRLDVVRINVPPLRDRAADIPLLAAHFWNEASARVGSRATLSGDALAALSRLDWPGNVRELQNVIAWMAVHSPRRGRIGAAGLPAGLASVSATRAVTFDEAREDFERRFVKAALARANGHRARAADAMGISRQGLAKMIRRLRIEAP